MVSLGQIVVEFLCGRLASLLVPSCATAALWVATRSPAVRRSLGPAIRSALWWLICLRYVAALIPLPQIAVPIPMPVQSIVSEHRVVPVASRGAAPQSHFPVSNAVPAAKTAQANAQIVGDAAASSPGRSAPHGVVAERPERKPGSSARQVCPADWRTNAALAASVFWLLGAVIGLAAMAANAVALGRVLRESSPCAAGNEAHTALLQICAAMRVRPPMLTVHPGAVGPLVAGPIRPTIVLPDLGPDGMVGPRLRAILAHEVAHVKRGDLWLGFVPGLSRCLLWWMPPVWLTVREYRTATEEACDMAARRAAAVSVADYADLLIGLAAPTPSRAGAANLSAAYRALRPRLQALGDNGRTVPRRSVCCLAVALATLALPAYRAMPAASSRSSAAELAGAPIAPVYRLVDLGVGVSGASAAYAIGDNGEVVGFASQRGWPPRTQALQWFGAAATKSPSIDGYRSMRAIAMDTSGDVALEAFNYRAWKHAAVATDGSAAMLGTLPGFRFGAATAVAPGATVAGYIYRRLRGGQLQARPVVWRIGSAPSVRAPQDIGTLGGLYGAAYGIGDAGLVVGKADTSDGFTHAFAWSRGHMTDLGALPGGLDSAAYAVNSHGEIVGYSAVGGAAVQAAEWPTSDAAPIELPGLFQGGIAKARSLNDVGAVVGVSTRRGGVDAHATLWVNGKTLDLNRLAGNPRGWVLRYALSIDNSGDIVGVGQFRGRTRAFLLEPEPV